MQINPVVEKELKVKMRGWKAPTLVSVYLLFLGLVVFLSYLGSNLLSPYNIGQFNPRTALNSYTAVAMVQLLLLIFITPSLTGSAISGERERQTLDLLLCTNLSTLSVVTGKAFVSIAHIMLLITASLPIMSTVFLFGGIRITDLLMLFGFYLSTALFLGSMGIFYSTIFKKNSVSMIVSYITVLAIIIGTSIGYAIWTSYYMRMTNQPPNPSYALFFMFANPMYGFSSVVEGGDSVMSIFGMFGIPMGRYYSPGAYAGQTSVVSSIAWLKDVKPWMANIAFDLVSSAFFILFSAWKIKPVRKQWFRRKPKSVPAAEINNAVNDSL